MQTLTTAQTTVTSYNKLAYINMLISKSIMEQKICIANITNAYAKINKGNVIANSNIMDKVCSTGQWENKCVKCIANSTCYSTNNKNRLISLGISNKL